MVAFTFLESLFMNSFKFCRGCNFWTSDFLDGCGLCYSCMDYTPNPTKAEKYVKLTKENVKEKYKDHVTRKRQASVKEREQKRHQRILLSLGREIN